MQQALDVAVWALESGMGELRVAEAIDAARPAPRQRGLRRVAPLLRAFL